MWRDKYRSGFLCSQEGAENWDRNTHSLCKVFLRGTEFSREEFSSVRNGGISSAESGGAQRLVSFPVPGLVGFHAQGLVAFVQTFHLKLA